MTVSIKDHIYEMDRKSFKKMMKQLKDSLKKKPMILAIELNSHIEMRNDVYKNQKDLTEAVCKWNKLGYKVHYTRGI